MKNILCPFFCLYLLYSAVLKLYKSVPVAESFLCVNSVSAIYNVVLSMRIHNVFRRVLISVSYYNGSRNTDNSRYYLEGVRNNGCYVKYHDSINKPKALRNKSYVSCYCWVILVKAVYR